MSGIDARWMEGWTGLSEDVDRHDFGSICSLVKSLVNVIVMV